MRIIVLLAALASLAASTAQAQIEVRGAWIPATPPGARTAAAYGTIINRGPTSDRLLGGRTGAAASLEAHRMSMAGGVMRMRQAVGGLPIGASASITLAPNGDHLMLIGLRTPMRPGQRIRIVLRFQRAGDVPVAFAVRPMGGPPPMGRTGM